jgi:hypothetical protein
LYVPCHQKSPTESTLTDEPSGIQPMMLARLTLVGELRNHSPEGEVTVTFCGWPAVGVSAGLLIVSWGVGVGDGLGEGDGDSVGDGLGLVIGVAVGEGVADGDDLALFAGSVCAAST